MKPEVLSFRLRIERDDSIPAFAAFLRKEPPDPDPVILINVEAMMSPESEDEDGKPVQLTREERKQNLIASLMHEFGHALESHLGLPVNEEAIERACDEWEGKQLGGQGAPSTPEPRSIGLDRVFRILQRDQKQKIPYGDVYLTRGHREELIRRAEELQLTSFSRHMREFFWKLLQMPEYSMGMGDVTLTPTQMDRLILADQHAEASYEELAPYFRVL